MASTKVQRIMTQPINRIFRFFQSKARIQIWLFEQKDLRIEGRIIVKQKLKGAKRMSLPSVEGQEGGKWIVIDSARTRRRFNGLHNISRTSEYIQRKAFSNSSSINNADDDSICPVLIVGAGPVGLSLSLLLTKLGVKCAVLEKSTTFSKHPQAHFINNRSMEVFRKFNGLAEDIQKSQPPVESWRKFIYCTSLTGSVLGSVDHMQPQDFDRIVSPVSVAHFSQYKLTRLLLKQLESLDFHVHPCEGLESLNHGLIRGREILMGHECVSIDATDNYVTVTASFLKDGKSMEKDIKCNILVGTDGAGSTVRKLMGIDMRGEKNLQRLVSVHFMSRELGQYLINERPGMLFFIFNTEAIGVLVAHDLKLGEFVLQLPFYPPQQKLEDFSFKMCERLISKLVGREFADIDVIDIKPWVMHAEVAEKYISHYNQIILAGDAAHRFPPAGGFGMNTGIQDAHNLAWKLASIFKGIASKSLLATYETERRPIAIFNTALSVQNFRAAMAIPAALGLDPTIANSGEVSNLFPSSSTLNPIYIVVFHNVVSIVRYAIRIVSSTKRYVSFSVSDFCVYRVIHLIVTRYFVVSSYVYPNTLTIAIERERRRLQERNDLPLSCRFFKSFFFLSQSNPSSPNHTISRSPFFFLPSPYSFSVVP